MKVHVLLRRFQYIVGVTQVERLKKLELQKLVTVGLQWWWNLNRPVFCFVVLLPQCGFSKHSFSNWFFLHTLFPRKIEFRSQGHRAKIVITVNTVNVDSKGAVESVGINMVSILSRLNFFAQKSKPFLLSRVWFEYFLPVHKTA